MRKLTVVNYFEMLSRSFRGNSLQSIKNDIAVITGAGSGIGRLVAYRLAKLGATVVSIDINVSGNEETAK